MSQLEDAVARFEALGAPMSDELADTISKFEALARSATHSLPAYAVSA